MQGEKFQKEKEHLGISSECARFESRWQAKFQSQALAEIFTRP